MFKLKRFGMGNNASQLEKELGAEQIPVNERYYGLVRVLLRLIG
jgi:hypothetical protein